MQNDLEIRLGVVGGDDIRKLNDQILKTEMGVKKLAKAYTKGQLNSVAIAKGVNQLRDELVDMGVGAKKAESSILKLYNAEIKTIKSTQNLAKAQKQLTLEQMAATKESNRLGIVTQQAGYQVSDFIVQIQSGTNGFVAFGQQASQLVGVLPLVASRIGLTAGAAIGLSASLGIIIPIITMVGAALTRTGSEAKTFSDAIGEAESALSDYEDALDNVLNKDLDQEFGSTAELIRNIEEATLDLSLALGKIEISNAFAKLTEDVDASLTATQKFLRGMAKSGANILDVATFGLGGYTTSAGKMFTGQEALNKLGIGDIVKEEDIVNLQKLFETGQFTAALIDIEDIFNDIKASNKTLGVDAISFLLNLKDTAQVASDLQGKLDGSAEKAEENAKVQKEIDDLIADVEKGLQKTAEQAQKNADAAKKERQEREELLKGFELTMRRKAEVLGLDGRSLLVMKQAQQQQDLQNKLLEAGLDVHDNQYLRLKKQLTNLHQAELAEYDRLQRIKEQAKQAERLAKAIEATARAAANFDSFMGKAGSKIPELRARLAVLRGGGTEAEAGIAGVREKAIAEFQARAGTTGGAPPAVMAQQSEYVAKKVEEAELEAQITAELNARREAEKGVGKTALQTLKERLTLEQALIGKTEAQRQIIQALGVDYKKTYDEDIITGLENTINKTIELQNEQERLLDIVDSIESNFGDALMGIVTDFDILNGSIEDFGYNAEQVFKNMAREIIKELYRIFVVKKITGFISGAVGDVASLYQGSTGFMQFSGGGYTGSGPRSGGLDGKGGFLAMLHPRETVIDHTKGQSAEGVTVVQNINISTGVQQTVRNEIRTLMPQIANSAKAAVSDAKRRGGSYGRAFS